jgi:predicted nucleotidyltransferase
MDKTKNNYKSWKTITEGKKPLKYIYPDQDKIREKVVEFILPYLKKHKFFNKVWIWGSLSKGKFGIYETMYSEKEASDIDLLVEVDESYNISKELRELKKWTKTRTYSRAFSSSLKFIHNNIEHTVDFICHWPSQHTKKKFNSKVEESILIYEKH